MVIAVVEVPLVVVAVAVRTLEVVAGLVMVKETETNTVVEFTMIPMKYELPEGMVVGTLMVRELLQLIWPRGATPGTG